MQKHTNCPFNTLAVEQTVHGDIRPISKCVLIVEHYSEHNSHSAGRNVSRSYENPELKTDSQ
jgi:hypothetical protein